MSDLTKEIKAYELQQENLEAQHTGRWVLFYQEKLINVYDSFEVAAEDAVRKFGFGPYLIRRVGAPPITLSASIMYRVKHG